MKKLLSILLAALTLFSIASAETKVAIDWSVRYPYAELESQLSEINQTYPEITSLYPIGHSWQERTLWCMELTDPSVDKADKTGVAVMANIHGGERESAACAMYFAWWLAENSQTERVLYPWCYRAYDASQDSESILYMKEVAQKMAEAFQETTGRGFYSKSSYEDYPTSAELIDYAYGRLNIDAYTIEVYSGGKSEDGDISKCKWEDELPEATWKFYTQDELAAMGLDLQTLTDRKGQPLRYGEGLWFYTSARAQTVNTAPQDQQLMAEGCKDALLVMIDSEPNGQGYTKPEYLNWTNN